MTKPVAETTDFSGAIKGMIPEDLVEEIIGPDGKVHYRRPRGHPDIAEALRTPGYWVRTIDAKFVDRAP